jgi:glycosyltransferase involved in cell wall biosynthesis
MLAGKPILQASDARNDIVSEAGCGFTVGPDDPAAFAAAARQLQSLPPEERQRLGENGRRFVIEHHDCRLLARNFLHAAMQAPCNAQRLSTRPARRIERDSLVENELPTK